MATTGIDDVEQFDLVRNFAFVVPVGRRDVVLYDNRPVTSMVLGLIHLSVVNVLQ